MRIAMRGDKTDQSFAVMSYAGAAIINSRCISTGPRKNSSRGTATQHFLQEMQRKFERIYLDYFAIGGSRDPTAAKPSDTKSV